jgi:hypothetical protein
MSTPVEAALTVEQAHRIVLDIEHSVSRLAAATAHTEPVSAAEMARDTRAHHR